MCTAGIHLTCAVCSSPKGTRGQYRLHAPAEVCPRQPLESRGRPAQSQISALTQLTIPVGSVWGWSWCWLVHQPVTARLSALSQDNEGPGNACAATSVTTERKRRTGFLNQRRSVGDSSQSKWATIETYRRLGQLPRSRSAIGSSEPTTDAETSNTTNSRVLTKAYQIISMERVKHGGLSRRCFPCTCHWMPLLLSAHVSGSQLGRRYDYMRCISAMRLALGWP